MHNVFMNHRTAENTLPKSNEVPVVMIVERVDVGFNQVSKDIDSFWFIDVDVLTLDLITFINN